MRKLVKSKEESTEAFARRLLAEIDRLQRAASTWEADARNFKACWDAACNDIAERDELLAEFVRRFEDYEDAGPTGETWQSEALTALIKKTKALLVNAPLISDGAIKEKGAEIEIGLEPDVRDEAMKAYRDWCETADGDAVLRVYNKTMAMEACWWAGFKAARSNSGVGTAEPKRGD